MATFKSGGERRAYFRLPKGKEQKRRWRLRKRHGITLDEYNVMLARQNGRCGLCGDVEHAVEQSNGLVRNLAVDHDHTTGATRSLLCSKCNLGLGLFEDDPVLLGKAIEYLGKYGCE